MVTQTLTPNLLDSALVAARLQPHPLAEFYPMQDPARYGELVDGMKKSGYRNEFPVVVYEGKILDGRNRYRAALELGIEPYMVPFSGDDPVDFVIQANSNRRDLEAGQRYIIYKEIMASTWAQRGLENKRAAGGDRKSENAKSLLANLPKAIDNEERVLPQMAKPEEGERGQGLANSTNLTPIITHQELSKARKSAHVTYGPDEDDYQEDYGGTEVKPTKVNTRAEIAKAAGVSDGMAAMVDYVEKRAPALYESIKRGEMTPNEAKSKVKEIERAENRAAKIEQITQGNKPLETGKTYNVICADPPWRYDFSKSDSREIENQYPTMDMLEICDLPVADIRADDCVLFLWATSPKLQEALAVMAAWGFQYKTNMVWDKEKIGMGYYARQQHELILIGTRGNLPTPAPENRPESVIRSPRGKHSEKPDAFYQAVERMYPEYECVELFAREPRAGWDVWGNQV